jgi:sortase A
MARSVRRLIGLLLLLVGMSALGWAGLITARSWYVQELHRRELPTVKGEQAPRLGGVLGLLEVPRLRLSSIVLEGDEEPLLMTGVGHLPDTPLPWQTGNSVLAAHRDRDFRPLEGIRVGDVVRFETADAELEFVVREAFVVEPTEVSVLRPTSEPTLTLITCYPFHYIGPAPKRFVVRAERIANRVLNAPQLKQNIPSGS